MEKRLISSDGNECFKCGVAFTAEEPVCKWRYHRDMIIDEAELCRACFEELWVEFRKTNKTQKEFYYSDVNPMASMFRNVKGGKLK